MRARSLIAVAALALVGLWVVAGSKPGSESGSSTDPSAPSRNLLLAEPPQSDDAVASELEAGKPVTPIPVSAVARKQVATVEAPAEAEHDHAAMAEALPAPELSRTATESDNLPLRVTMVTAPEAPIFGAPRPIPGATAEPVDTRWVPEPTSRRPTIIIRGGMGSPHDDCKIHAPGRMGGSAVNRMAPPVGGGFRGGIR